MDAGTEKQASGSVGTALKTYLQFSYINTACQGEPSDISHVN